MLKQIILLYSFLQILIIKSQEVSEYQFKRSDFEYDGSCMANDRNCVPIKDNFITKILHQISEEKIESGINEQISHYSNKDISVRQTKNMGLGLFTNKKLQANQKIFRFNVCKILSSCPISHGMFFQNTLTLQDKRKFGKIKFYKQLQENPNMIQLKESYLVIQILYHFTHFNRSFLQGDLSGQILITLKGFPATVYTPILNTTDYEMKLLEKDKNYQYLHMNLLHFKVNTRKSYRNFMRNLDSKLSSEEFYKLFQKHTFTFDEYSYVQFLIRSRSHQLHKEIAIIPGLNYINMESVTIKKNKFQFVTGRKYRNLVYEYRTADEFPPNKELLSGGYIQEINAIYYYLLFYGFVPTSLYNNCFTFNELTYDESLYYKIPMSLCLQSDGYGIKAYTAVKYIKNMTEEKRKEVMGSIMEFLWPLDQYENGNYQTYTELLPLFYKNVKIDSSVWDQELNEIETQLNNFKDIIVYFKQYYEYRLTIQKDTYVSKLLIEFYSFLIKEALRTKNDILQVKNTIRNYNVQ